jgi:hypothetical protein
LSDTGICAVPVAEAGADPGDGGFPQYPAGTPCGTTDGNGNYSLAVPPGQYRLCTGAAHPEWCDPCAFAVGAGTTIRRDLMLNCPASYFDRPHWTSPGQDVTCVGP